jgi:hypothetical protein
MIRIVLIVLISLVLTSCKTQKSTCDAYAKLENKKDHH